MRPSPSTYVAAAWDAVRYVKNRIKHGSFNNSKDILFGPPGSVITSFLIQTNGQKNLILPELKKLREGGASTMDKEARNLLMVEVWAKHALTMQAGNCGLQTALAFEYLRKHKKIFPLDYMGFKDKDHAFCILGRHKDTDLENFADWTRDALVCDPWRGNVGVAGQLIVWYGTTKVESLCRIEADTDEQAMGYQGPPAYEFAR